MKIHSYIHPERLAPIWNRQKKFVNKTEAWFNDDISQYDNVTTIITFSIDKTSFILFLIFT